MAITTVDQIIAAYGSVQTFNTRWPSATTVAGQPFSSWMNLGFPGGPSAVPPSGGEAPTAATTGCLFPFTNSAISYLSRLTALSGNGGAIVLYDRLYHHSNFSGTVLTAQNCPAVALTRYTNGVGVEAYLECYTPTGVTSSTFTASYTNQAGTAGQSGTFVGKLNGGVGMMGGISLAAGDTGIKSVQSITLTPSTGTAGNFGVTLLKRLATIPVTGNIGSLLDVFDLGQPTIQNSACLSMMYIPNTTSTGDTFTSLDIIQG